MNRPVDRRQSSNRRRAPRLFARSLFVLFWIAVWWVLSVVVANPILLPSPVDVVRALSQMVATSDFWMQIAHSFYRISLGFVVATLIGIGLGVLAYRHQFVEELLRPLIGLFRATPVAAITIVLLVWLESRQMPQVLVLLSVLPLIYESTLAGLNASDPKLLEMSQIYQLSDKDVWKHIERPSLIAYLKPSLLHAIGFSWKVGISGEILSQSFRGLGTAIYEAKVGLSTDQLLAFVIVIVILSAGLTACLRRLVAMLSWDSRSNCVAYSRASSSVVATENAANHPVLTDETRKPVGLRIKHLEKGFGEDTVLHGFSMEILEGELRIVRGVSGAGKTTLFRILAGLEEKDSGDIEWVKDGCDVPSKDVIVSYCFQEPRLIEHLSGVDNLYLALREVQDDDMAKKRLRDMLIEAGIEAPDQRVRFYSGGMRQRVAILRALVHNGDVLIFDEPFKELDEENKENMMSIVKRQTLGKTALLATHDNGEASFFDAKVVSIPKL